MSNRLLDLDEVAGRLDLTPKTLREWIKAGRLPGLRVRGISFASRRRSLRSGCPANSSVPTGTNTRGASCWSNRRLSNSNLRDRAQ